MGSRRESCNKQSGRLKSPFNPAQIGRCYMFPEESGMSPVSPTRADRIAIVDDDARIRDLLRRYLTQEGF